MMLLENVVTRRVSEENVSKSSLTRRVTKQGYLLLAVPGSFAFALTAALFTIETKARYAPNLFDYLRHL